MPAAAARRVGLPRFVKADPVAPGRLVKPISRAYSQPYLTTSSQSLAGAASFDGPAAHELLSLPPLPLPFPPPPPPKAPPCPPLPPGSALCSNTPVVPGADQLLTAGSYAELAACTGWVVQACTSTYNGCGPDPTCGCQSIHYGGFLAPGVNATDCCNDHDCCYGTCNSERARCDADLLECALNKCAEVYGPAWGPNADALRDCELAAGALFQAVHRGGQCAWECAQVQDCRCSPCPPGMANCSGQCVDTISDPNNCGGCGQACPPGEICTFTGWPPTDIHCQCGDTGGSCGAPPKACCEDACVDLDFDNENCGACGNELPAGQVCCFGKPVDANANPDCGGCGYICSGDTACCGNGDGGMCVDITTTEDCGGCGSSYSVGTPRGQTCGADESCCGGKCCQESNTCCFGTTCADLQTDPTNCGYCGFPCATGGPCCNGFCCLWENGTCCGDGGCCEEGSICCNGQCCEPGEQCCNGTCTEVEFDPNNCGKCGNVCPDEMMCCNGTCCCSDGTCGPGGVCDVTCDPPDHKCCKGSCKDIQTDPQNCGGCGDACKNGNDVCCDGNCYCGSCDTTCNSGEYCCSGTCVDLQTSAANCGSCNASCLTNETCAAGKCKCGAKPGCTGSDSCCGDACTDLQTDAKNCKACGRQCLYTNQRDGTEQDGVCVDGTCRCPSGWPVTCSNSGDSDAFCCKQGENCCWDGKEWGCCSDSICCNQKCCDGVKCCGPGCCTEGEPCCPSFDPSSGAPVALGCGDSGTQCCDLVPSGYCGDTTCNRPDDDCEDCWGCCGCGQGEFEHYPYCCGGVGGAGTCTDDTANC